MSFAVTLEGEVKGVFGTQLRYSTGLRLYATEGVTISWLSDTKFRIVLPSNEGIGTQFLFVQEGYFGRLYTVTKVLLFNQVLDLVVWMDASGTVLYGSINETVSGEVITGATISISPGEHEVGIIDNSTMYYSIIQDAGTYTVAFSKQGYSSVQRTINVEATTLEDYGKTILLHVGLTLLSGEYYGNLEGVVTKDASASQSASLEGATVTMSGSGIIATATTDQLGAYNFHVPIGLYTVTFQKTGYEDATGSVIIRAGQIHYYNMWMHKPDATVEGTIKYISGYTPGSDLQIKLVRDDGAHAQYLFKTAGDTTFRFDDIKFAGRYKVTARTACLQTGIRLFGKVPYFNLNLWEIKKVGIVMDKKQDEDFVASSPVTAPSNIVHDASIVGASTQNTSAISL